MAKMMMDGDMEYFVDATGAGWLDQPVMLHSSRMSSCDLTPEQCAYKSQHWLSWYEADHQYGLPVIAFLLSVITLFAIGALGDLLVPAALQRWSVYRRLKAAVRYLAYKCFNLRVMRWFSPSLGVLLTGAVGVIFFLAMTLGKRPYYWPNTEEVNYGDSPPIATRAGWMSIACLPFVLTLAAKENPVTVLTRVAYEKLNVFHRWISWAMYALALVHTFPFIVYHRKQGDVGMQWGTSVFYWTGVVALLAQTWLMFMSIGFIRNRFYEFFKACHLLMAAVFFVFLFIHCDFRLSSWDYLIAAAVLYSLCWGASTLRTLFEHGPLTTFARLELLPHNTLKITVAAASDWAPGQHVFLRFLSLDVHSMTAHPFTICSLPQPITSTKVNGKHEMVFYIQPRGGYTQRLAAIAQKQPNRKIKVSLDGPYGGIKDRSLAAFDRAVIIAGGAGAGFVLPVLEDILKRRQKGFSATSVRVVFSARNYEQVAWFKSEVADLLAKYDATGVTIDLHVTGDTKNNRESVREKEDTGSSEDIESGKDIANHTNTSIGSDINEELRKDLRIGRPDTKGVLRKEVDSFTGSIGIAVCGPEDMLYDVRNAAASAQTLVRSGGLQEVYLYSECFGW